MAKRKSRGTKGMHCVRYKRVRVKGRGVQKRCAKFAKGARRKGRR